MMRVRDGISRDLVISANDPFFRSSDEKRALLREASAAIRCYQALAAISGPMTNDPARNIAVQLSQFADDLDFRYADETKAIMIKAADTIRLLRLMLGIKQESV
jgi:hypothetical protein